MNLFYPRSEKHPFKSLPIEWNEDPRPYDQSILQAVDWNALYTELVQFSDLHIVQYHCTVRGLLGIEKHSTDPFPHVVRWQGELYLEDGCHRVVHRAILGGTDGMMRVVRFLSEHP